jgi:hypothetical protein
MTATSRVTAERKPEARSRIGNGKSLFLGTVGGEPVDGRTIPARYTAAPSAPQDS